MWEVINDNYNYLMHDAADSRVQDWALFRTPLPLTSIIVTYLISIYYIFPKFMENRKPYSLKTVIFYYNIFQIFACVFIIYGILTSGWTTYYSLGCQPPDYSDEPLAVRMLSFVYYTFLLKWIELIETVFFVLRKKYNQVSNLHVYHHCSTLFISWLGVKYVAGGMATFPIIVNSFIHVIMYTYYLLSSLGPEWQITLKRWKPKITICQLVQFCILIAHSLQSLSPSCNVKKTLLLFYVPNVVLLFNMFYKFYQNSYVRKPKKL